MNRSNYYNKKLELLLKFLTFPAVLIYCSLRLVKSGNRDDNRVQVFRQQPKIETKTQTKCLNKHL